MKKIHIFLILTFFALFTQTTFALVSQPYAEGNYHFEPSERNNEIKFVSTQAYNRTIYLDSKSGDDSNNGISKGTPIKTIGKLMTMNITFGDQILLKGGETFNGCIDLTGLNNAIPTVSYSTQKPHIHIGSYGNSKAIIDCSNYKAGIWIENSSFIDISDLKITGNGGDDENTLDQRYGIRIESNNNITNNLVSYISIYNVDIYDIFLLNPVSDENARICNQWDMNDSAGWGWGIIGETLNSGKGIYNVNVKNVDVRNVSNIGIRFRGKGTLHSDDKTGKCDSIKISYCNVFQTGGPGMQFNKTDFSYMKHCRITESGNRNDNRKWGRGSGMWTWGCNRFLLEYNIFEGAQGIGDSCGAHIDFNCSNVVIQYCLSRYNCGGFIEILGLNSNNCYRFNVSINDGWRNMDDPEQDFWGDTGGAGEIFTVNGHNGSKQYLGPYKTYIYNNTIINTENTPFTNPFRFVIATSNEGLLIKNNIFWASKKFQPTWSMHNWKDGAAYDAASDFMISYESSGSTNLPDKNDPTRTYAHTRNMNETELAKLDLEADRNIFKLKEALDDMPKGYRDADNGIQVYSADPLFANVNGYEAKDFIPSADFISQGVEITLLKTDDTDYGVMGGLKMHKDFFGNPISDDENIIGAIVPNAPDPSAIVNPNVDYKNNYIQCFNNKEVFISSEMFNGKALLYDITGHYIKNLSVGMNDLSGFSKGIYFVKIYNNGNNFSKKIILK